MKTIHLREWTVEPALQLSPPVRDALRRNFDASVQPTPGFADRYDVRPGSRIGALVVDDVSIVVQPKISIRNVLFLLSYCVQPNDWRADDALLDDRVDLTSGLAALFASLAERATRRGLLAGYRDAADDLYTVRGRIDLADQLRRRPGSDLPLAVRYQVFDHDIIENQLLEAATRAFRGLPIRSSATRRSLYRLTTSLEDVSTRFFPASAVPEVYWQRLNRHYQPAVELARIILRHRSLDLAQGDASAPALILDLASVFEEFLRIGLREALRASDQDFPAPSKLPKVFVDDRSRVRLRPDLTYWPGGKCRYVGDAKYKVDEGEGQSADLYQLLAYAIALQLPTATLIYAAGPSLPRRHRIPGADVVLHLRHLDLALPPREVLGQIDVLAAEIAEPITRS